MAAGRPSEHGRGPASSRQSASHPLGRWFTGDQGHSASFTSELVQLRAAQGGLFAHQTKGGERQRATLQDLSHTQLLAASSAIL